MKKGLLISTLLIFATFSGVKANAQEATSNGTAILSDLGENAEAVKPEDPDANFPDGTGQTGLLTIDGVPYFDFQGTGLKGTFADVVPEGHVRNVQVSDRRGTGAGWQLGLKIAAFKTAEGVALKGAKITLPASVRPGQNNESNAPATVNSVDGLIDPTNGLDAGILTQAAKDEGYGTWITEFKNAVLNVADGNAKGSYTSVFTWSLGSTPTGSEE